MIKQAATVLGFRIVGAGLAFGANIYIAHALGVVEYGSASFVVAAAMFGALLSVFGSNRIVTKYVARTIDSDESIASRYVRQAVRQTLLAALPVLTLVALALVASAKSSIEILLFALLALLISIKQLGDAFLLGCSKGVFVAFHESFARPVGLALGVLIAQKLGQAHSVAYLFSMSVTLIVIIASIWIYSWRLVDLSSGAPVHSLGTWWRESLPFFLLTTVVVIQNQAGVFFLGLFSSNVETGLYAVASRISMLISFSLVAANMVYMGSYSKAYEQGDLGRLNKDVRMVSLFTGGFLFVAFPLLVIKADMWLGFFGQDFEAGREILIVQATALFLSAMFGPAALLLSMTDYAEEAARIMVVVALCNLALTVVFVLFSGGVGAAFANLLTVVVSNAILMTMVWRRLGVRSGVIGLLVFGRRPQGETK